MPLLKQRLKQTLLMTQTLKLMLMLTQMLTLTLTLTLKLLLLLTLPQELALWMPLPLLVQWQPRCSAENVIGARPERPAQSQSAHMTPHQETCRAERECQAGWALEKRVGKGVGQSVGVRA